MTHKFIFYTNNIKMAQDATVSFRQAGREVSGKVYKGSIVDAFNRLTQPSIPAKSEQVLTQVNKKGGFGASADRFMSKSYFGPGPGQYVAAEQELNPSMSKKGFGGLINRAPRFKKFQYNTAVPGPGSYENKLRDIKTVSSVFIEGRSKSLVTKYDPPAPGQYNPKTPEGKRMGMTSTFKSKTKRLEPTNPSDAPPPWQYNVEGTMIRSSSAQNTAAFKMPVQARRYQINLYDPHSDIITDDMPGPGEYSAETGMSNIKPSPMFIVGEVDRFGKPLRPRKKNDFMPGPGTYSMAKSDEKLPVSGAVFMSESERAWFSTEKKPPGPAFYKPAPVPKKKSFHLNSNKMWV
ncbi:unnamed protein product [Blepharisma stoltei]|uniref:Sperm-tail PG-rich repeat-containing protein 2 n=1 Tax=Blepharisma stoltei TaxID=1481888 RepID=A0AAU9J5Y7_9CILI|nr:unnamed protein product [Blepharisma stoltei]